MFAMRIKAWCVTRSNPTLDAMGRFEFFSYRKRGVEPSQIPHKVADEVIDWVYEQDDYFMFDVKPINDFKFAPPRGSLSKNKCSLCGEYVFDRYMRTVDGKPVCIPCSGYDR